MTHRKLIEQMLEALDSVTEYVYNNLSSDYPTGVDLRSKEFDASDEAITAAREYLAQPEQSEPIAFFDFQEHLFYWAPNTSIGAVPVSIKVEPMALYTAPPLREPEQSEPVAFRAWFDKDNGARWLFTLWPEEERLDVDWQPLYTHPAPPLRELSKTEIDTIAQQVGVTAYEAPEWMQDFATSVLAAARSKT